MHNTEDIPFYIIIIGVISNIIIGLLLKTPFIMLMIRSIIVTIICSLLGYIAMIIASEMSKKSKLENVATKDNTIDYSIPPISEQEFIQYEDDSFVETNPADLHKYNSDN